MEVKAQARFLQISPRKVRSVVDVIRGMQAQAALGQLGAIRREAARPIAKLIKSAIANAEHNFSLDPLSLKIDEIFVDGGPVLQRYKPRAFGRASRIRRRTSHITLILEGTRVKKEKNAPKPPSEVKEVDKDRKTTSEKDFEIKKKVGKERRPSLARRLFRRKSI
jgi:large subunit ribosomal protein L22